MDGTHPLDSGYPYSLHRLSPDLLRVEETPLSFENENPKSQITNSLKLSPTSQIVLKFRTVQMTFMILNMFDIYLDFGMPWICKHLGFGVWFPVSLVDFFQQH